MSTRKSSTKAEPAKPKAVKADDRADDRKPPDPRTIILAKQINDIALAKGLSQNKLSAAAGIKPQQWSALLHGRSGISDEKLHNAAAEVGVVLAVSGATEVRPAFLGSATAGGRVTMTGTDTVLPAYVAIDEACGDYRVGDEVLIVAGGFTPGEELLVKGPSGLLFAEAFERNGEKKLRTLQGETFDYSPELHRVVGIVDGFRRPKRRPVQ